MRFVSRDESRYARLCEEQLAAADIAATKDARIAHLEQAFLFAQRAAKARTSERAIEVRD